MTVTGDARVGIDTLTAVEAVRGTNFADTYNATGFNGASTDFGPSSSFNEFEGLAGNDTITGNGNTRISYVSATGGVVYVMGGRVDAAPFDLAVVEAYDPVANAWTTKASMTAITGGLVGVALGGSIYALPWNTGYTTVEAYDPVANSWSAKAALRVGFSSRDWFTATAAGNAIYTLGGFDSFGTLTTVEAVTP